MRKTALQALRQRYVFQCGYCGITETENGAALTVDHFHPRSQGGSDDSDNLVYCCHACNEQKGDWWNPDGIERILHPLQDNVPSHIELRDDGLLYPLTETGAFHIRWLHLNRSPLVKSRRTAQIRDEERRERQEVLVILRLLSTRLSAIEEAISDKQRGGE